MFNVFQTDSAISPQRGKSLKKYLRARSQPKDRLMPVGIMPVVMRVLHGIVIIMMRIDRDVMPMPERIDHHLRN